MRERLSADVSAVESYGRFREADVVRSDWSAGIDHLNTVTQNDPTFALAQLDLALLLMNNNRPQEAAAAIRAALDHVYRLPERLQFIVKANYYSFAGDVPRAMALLEMRADLYPEDPMALGNLVGALTNRGDWEGRAGDAPENVRAGPPERRPAEAHGDESPTAGQHGRGARDASGVRRPRTGRRRGPRGAGGAVPGSRRPRQPRTRS